MSQASANTGPFRVLIVGLGPLGKIIAADALERGVARIVAAADVSHDIAGSSLSRVVPGADATVVVRPSVEAWLRDAGPRREGIDCAIVATSSDLAKAAPAIRTLLDAGVSVVSTCEELLFPWLRHPGLAEELDVAAKRTGARLVGTGVNPGFMMDTLPVFVTGVCKTVRAVKVWRIQDATTRRIPFQQKIGAGLDDAAFERKIADGSLRHVGLGESLHFIARYLGFKIARWEESIGPVKAERDLTCALGPIPRGRAAGVRQVAHGYDAEHRAVVTMEFQAAIGQSDPHDRVQVDGDPAIDVVFKGGVHGDIATSAITLNSIAPLLASPPGLHTMATMPLPHWSRGR